MEHQTIFCALILWILKSNHRNGKEVGGWMVTVIGIKWEISAIDGEDT